MVKICLPYYKHEMISPQTELSIKRATETGRYVCARASSTYISSARNSLMSEDPHKKVLGDFDGYITIDHDMEFTVSQLDALVESGRNIIGGAYRQAYKNRLCAGYFDKGKGAGWNGDFLPVDQKGIVEVDWHGTGMLYISRPAAEGIEFPFFGARVIEHGDERAVVTDDVDFCMRAKDVGLSVYCNADIRVEHLVDEINVKYGDITTSIDNMINPEKTQIFGAFNVLTNTTLPMDVVDNIVKLETELVRVSSIMRRSAAILVNRHFVPNSDGTMSLDQEKADSFKAGMVALLDQDAVLKCKRPVIPRDSIEMTVEQYRATRVFVDWR